MGGYFEGTRLTAYRDVNGTPTICMGETHNVVMGMTMTQDQCNVLFDASMNRRTEAVRKMLKGTHPETRVAALAVFAYNEGEWRLQKSLALREINAGNITVGCNDLLNYTRAGAKHYEGLRRRRIAERDLCLMEPTHE